MKNVVINTEGAPYNRDDVCGWLADTDAIRGGTYELPEGLCGAPATFEFNSIHNVCTFRVCDEHAAQVRERDYVRGGLRPLHPSVA